MNINDLFTVWSKDAPIATSIGIGIGADTGTVLVSVTSLWPVPIPETKNGNVVIFE